MQSSVRRSQSPKRLEAVSPARHRQSVLKRSTVPALPASPPSSDDEGDNLVSPAVSLPSLLDDDTPSGRQLFGTPGRGSGIPSAYRPEQGVLGTPARQSARVQAETVGLSSADNVQDASTQLLPPGYGYTSDETSPGKLSTAVSRTGSVGLQDQPRPGARSSGGHGTWPGPGDVQAARNGQPSQQRTEQTGATPIKQVSASGGAGAVVGTPSPRAMSSVTAAAGAPGQSASPRETYAGAGGASSVQRHGPTVLRGAPIAKLVGQEDGMAPEALLIHRAIAAATKAKSVSGRSASGRSVGGGSGAGGSHAGGSALSGGRNRRSGDGRASLAGSADDGLGASEYAFSRAYSLGNDDNDNDHDRDSEAGDDEEDEDMGADGRSLGTRRTADIAMPLPAAGTFETVRSRADAFYSKSSRSSVDLLARLNRLSARWDAPVAPPPTAGSGRLGGGSGGASGGEGAGRPRSVSDASHGSGVSGLTFDASASVGAATAPPRFGDVPSQYSIPGLAGGAGLGQPQTASASGRRKGPRDDEVRVEHAMSPARAGSSSVLQSPGRLITAEEALAAVADASGRGASGSSAAGYNQPQVAIAPPAPSLAEVGPATATSQAGPQTVVDVALVGTAVWPRQDIVVPLGATVRWLALTLEQLKAGAFNFNSGGPTNSAGSSSSGSGRMAGPGSTGQWPLAQAIAGLSEYSPGRGLTTPGGGHGGTHGAGHGSNSTAPTGSTRASMEMTMMSYYLTLEEAPAVTATATAGTSTGQAHGAGLQSTTPGLSPARSTGSGHYAPSGAGTDSTSLLDTASQLEYGEEIFSSRELKVCRHGGSAVTVGPEPCVACPAARGRCTTMASHTFTKPGRYTFHEETYPKIVKGSITVVEGWHWTAATPPRRGHAGAGVGAGTAGAASASGSYNTSMAGYGLSPFDGSIAMEEGLGYRSVSGLPLQPPPPARSGAAGAHADIASDGHADMSPRLWTSTASTGLLAERSVSTQGEGKADGGHGTSAALADPRPGGVDPRQQQVSVDQVSDLRRKEVERLVAEARARQTASGRGVAAGGSAGASASASAASPAPVGVSTPPAKSRMHTPRSLPTIEPPEIPPPTPATPLAKGSKAGAAAGDGRAAGTATTGTVGQGERMTLGQQLSSPAPSRTDADQDDDGMLSIRTGRSGRSSTFGTARKGKRRAMLLPEAEDAQASHGVAVTADGSGLSPDQASSPAAVPAAVLGDRGSHTDADGSQRAMQSQLQEALLEAAGEAGKDDGLGMAADARLPVVPTSARKAKPSSAPVQAATAMPTAAAAAAGGPQDVVRPGGATAEQPRTQAKPATATAGVTTGKDGKDVPTKDGKDRIDGKEKVSGKAPNSKDVTAKDGSDRGQPARGQHGSKDKQADRKAKDHGKEPQPQPAGDKPQEAARKRSPGKASTATAHDPARQAATGVATVVGPPAAAVAFDAAAAPAAAPVPVGRADTCVSNAAGASQSTAAAPPQTAAVAVPAAAAPASPARRIVSIRVESAGQQYLTFRRATIAEGGYKLWGQVGKGVVFVTRRIVTYSDGYELIDELPIRDDAPNADGAQAEAHLAGTGHSGTVSAGAAADVTSTSTSSRPVVGPLQYLWDSHDPATWARGLAAEDTWQPPTGAA